MAKEAAGPIGTFSRRRWQSGNAIVEWDVVYVARGQLEAMFARYPRLKKYEREYIKTIGAWVLLENPFADKKVQVHPDYRAKAEAAHVEWCALLDQKVKIRSKKGVG